MLLSKTDLPKRTRTIYLSRVPVGGGNPVTVQSMTKTDTRDLSATVDQIHRLQDAGCEIIRVAVPDRQAGENLGAIKKAITIPLVADIHFDHRLALLALEQGVDGLRLNPGNIGSRERIAQVVKKAKERSVPIRIGVNAGSLEKKILKKHGAPSAEALVESALNHVRLLEDEDFNLIKISIKASDPLATVSAYRQISKETDYPLHVGVTEAGPPFTGAIKSAVALGILLNQGIGNTIRVSLTGEPVMEVLAGYQILRSLHLRDRGVEIVSCPTCGRSETNLAPIVREVEKRVSSWPDPLHIAIMGCCVNGPGEAREADVGVASGKGVGLVFRGGQPVRKVPEARIVDALFEEIGDLMRESASE